MLELSASPARDRIRDISHLAGRVAVFIPVLQLLVWLWLIWRHTPHLPYLDEWHTVGLVRQLRESQLTSLDMLAFHVEHRIVIPRIVHLLLIQATGWDRQVQMTFNGLVMVATVAILLSLVRRTCKSSLAPAVLIVPASLLFFSFAQYENWLWPFQLAFFSTVFGVACAALALGGRPANRLRVFTALLGAAIASLSSLPGLFVWFAFLPAFWRNGYARIAIWAVGALALLVPYFRGFPHSQIDQTAAHGQPITLMKYALAYLGAPVGYPSVTLSQVLAAGSLVVMLTSLLVYWLLRGEFRRVVPWIGLAIYASAVAAATALGRGFGPVETALGSRYQIFSSVWWFALVVIFWQSFEQVKAYVDARGETWTLVLPQGTRYINITVLPSVAGGIVLTFALTGVLHANARGLAHAPAFQARQLANEECVTDYLNAPDSCLQLFHWSPQVVRMWTAYLDNEDLALFRTRGAPRLTRAAGVAQASIETVGGQSVTAVAGPLAIPDDRPIVVEGRAVDPALDGPVGGVMVTVDGVMNVPAEYVVPRPDVAAAFSDNTLQPGFRATVPGGALLPGRHTLTIKALSGDRRSYYDGPDTVEVTVGIPRQSTEVAVPVQAPMGELVEGAKFSQTFVSRCSNLSQVSLFLATYVRTNTSPVIFRLVDASTNRAVSEQSFAGPSIQNNVWHRMYVEPVAESLGRTFRIDLTSPLSRPGDAITVWRSQFDAYGGGQALLNDQPIEGDLVFQYGCAQT